MPAILDAPAPAAPSGLRGMRVAEVAAKVGISIRAIWRLLHTDPAFPKPRKIGSASIWLSDDIDTYLNSLAPSR